MFVAIILLLSLQYINCQSKFQRIRLDLDGILQQFLNYYLQQQYKLLNLDNLPYINLKAEELLEYILLSSNTSSTYEPDIKLLIKVALCQELWVLKIFNSSGKPLPPGLLKGNAIWADNYDECLKSLYQYKANHFLNNLSILNI
ncbi:unnamed protein product, partial [Rotaria sp. Silwood2]